MNRPTTDVTQKALEAAGFTLNDHFLERYYNDTYVYHLVNLLTGYIERVEELEAEVKDLKEQVMCACSAHKSHALCSIGNCPCPTLKREKIGKLLHCGHQESQSTHLYWDNKGYPCCRDCWLKAYKHENK